MKDKYFLKGEQRSYIGISRRLIKLYPFVLGEDHGIWVDDYDLRSNLEGGFIVFSQKIGFPPLFSLRPGGYDGNDSILCQFWGKKGEIFPYVRDREGILFRFVPQDGADFSHLKENELPRVFNLDPLLEQMVTRVNEIRGAIFTSCSEFIRTLSN